MSNWERILLTIMAAVGTAGAQEANGPLLSLAPTESSTPPAGLEPAPATVWTQDVGSGFHKHTAQLGFSAGAGFTAGLTSQIIGGNVPHHIALGTLQA